jgi:thiol-disulfide isomerase/thioredoxin
MKKDWKKYAFTFLITAAIFITAIGISSWIDNRRVDEVKTMQDTISLSILSSETQFNLLKSADCSDLFSSELGKELGDMSDRLSYLESAGRGQDPDVVTLKQYYSLLEIKDYILINSATQCKNKPVIVLYFYQANCPDCDKQGDVLTYIRQHYPGNIRVYSFDDDLDVSAIKTLSDIYKVSQPLPALVIDGKTYNGFHSIDDIQAIAPSLVATTTATSTASEASTTSTEK